MPLIIVSLFFLVTYLDFVYYHLNSPGIYRRRTRTRTVAVIKTWVVDRALIISTITILIRYYHMVIRYINILCIFKCHRSPHTFVRALHWIKKQCSTTQPQRVILDLFFEFIRLIMLCSWAWAQCKLRQYKYSEHDGLKRLFVISGNTVFIIYWFLMYNN